MPQLIPFVELTGGTESVRFVFINGLTYMSISDIIMVVCKKDNNMVGKSGETPQTNRRRNFKSFLRTSYSPARASRSSL